MKHIFLIAVLCFAHDTWAQSYFYNTDQFGLQSTLLGGAVTSGNGDLSMAYYNPAALHLATSEADFSLIRPKFNTFSFNNYLGDEVNTVDTDIDLSPSLASLKLQINEKINLVLITIEKNSWDNSLQTQQSEEGNTTHREQKFKYNYSGKDRWIGAGVSIPLGGRISFGIGHFLSIAKFEYGYSIFTSTHNLLDNQRIGYFSDELISSASNNFSSVSKIGLHIRFPKHNLGLVVRTPNYFAISKNGSYERRTVDINPDESTAKNLIDFELEPDIKTPWEINVGYAFTMERGTKFWLNVAYYTAVPDYQMATIEGPDGSTLKWSNGSNEISNYSIGLSEKLSPNFELMASFRSNLFAYTNRAPKSDEARLIILNHDLHHVSIGANCKFKNHAVLLGVDMGFASVDNATLFADFPNMERLTTTPSDFKNNALSLLLTYGFLIDGLRGKK